MYVVAMGSGFRGIEDQGADAYCDIVLKQPRLHFGREFTAMVANFPVGVNVCPSVCHA